MSLASNIYQYLQANPHPPDLTFLAYRVGATEPFVADALDWLVESGYIGKGFETKGYKYRRSDQRDLHRKASQLNLLEPEEPTAAERHPSEGKKNEKGSRVFGSTRYLHIDGA